jgi:hypothetical protein
MMKDKPKLGQTLFSLNVGNAARNQEQVLTPVEVTKVGNKYFYCVREGSSRETKYNLHNWREATNFCVNSRLYVTQQEWLDEKESNDLERKIKDAFSIFGGAKFTLKQLREINAVISR